MQYRLEIYNKTSDIPEDWDQVVGKNNILLSKEYFCVLQESKPVNMQCYYVGFFTETELIGGALLQYLNFENHLVLQQKKITCSIRNFLTKTFSKEVLIVGNNMLTGQNGFYFDLEKISVENAAELLEKTTIEIQDFVKKPSIIIYKDYQKPIIEYFRNPIFKKYYEFSVQPNMILEIRTNWKTYEDYLQDFSKKYRQRANVARKKCSAIRKQELDLSAVILYQKQMNVLYHNVAENASINTFFLAENHFESLKNNLKEHFKVFGYFQEEQLVGFYTLILNHLDIDTYFLGYDKKLQKEKQLYLNMLLDMVKFGIEKNFKKVIFGRTALEIKSTIGAEPIEIYGIIKHNNPLINNWMDKIFPTVEPKVDWIQRNPFKN